MKFEKNNRYFTIALYAFGVIAAAIILVFVLISPDKLFGGITKIVSILTPLIIGFAIAFILNPLLKWFEKTVFKKVLVKKQQKKAKRTLSLVCTYLSFFGILSLFFALIVPSIVKSVSDLANNIQGYYNSGIALITNLLTKFNVSNELVNYFNDLGTGLIDVVIDLLKNISTYLPKIFDVALSAGSVIKNIVVGFALSIYMLSSKDVFKRQIKKIMTVFLKPETKEKTIRIFKLSHSTFSKYLTAYIIDSTIVGLITYFVMLIFGWPYPALIGLIIGV